MEYIDSTRTHLLKTEDADRVWSFCGRAFDLDMIAPVKHYFKQTCSVCQAAYDAYENEIATRRQMQEQEEREKLKAWNDAASSFTPSNKRVQPTA